MSSVLPTPTNIDLVIVGIVLFLFTALVVNISMLVSAISFIAAIVVMAYGFGYDVAKLLDQIPIPSVEPSVAEKSVLDELVSVGLPDDEGGVVLDPTDVPPLVRFEVAVETVEDPVVVMPRLGDIYDVDENDHMHLLGF